MLAPHEPALLLALAFIPKPKRKLLKACRERTARAHTLLVARPTLLPEAETARQIAVRSLMVRCQLCKRCEGFTPSLR